MSVEGTIWIAGYLLEILGLVEAVYSQQHLLWLAVWPAPVVLAATIFIFVRQGFHFQNGVLVLGRRCARLGDFQAMLLSKNIFDPRHCCHGAGEANRRDRQHSHVP